jgi:hypothetical protein
MREAEGEGFEPSERCYRSTVFKTAAINHSATPPGASKYIVPHNQCVLNPRHGDGKAARGQGLGG